MKITLRAALKIITDCPMKKILNVAIKIFVTSKKSFLEPVFLFEMSVQP